MIMPKKKYSAGAQKKMGKVMHEFKHHQLKTRGGRTVRSRQQAIAIGLSEARGSGARVPKQRSSSQSKAILQNN